MKPDPETRPPEADPRTRPPEMPWVNSQRLTPILPARLTAFQTPDTFPAPRDAGAPDQNACLKRCGKRRVCCFDRLRDQRGQSIGGSRLSPCGGEALVDFGLRHFHRKEDAFIVVDGRTEVWVPMARLLRELHEDYKLSAHQRLGLRQPVRVLIRSREVVQVSGDVGMLRPVALLIDLQGPLHQRLGLRQPVRGLIQLREVVEIYGDLGMLRPIALLVDRKARPSAARPPPAVRGTLPGSELTIDTRIGRAAGFSAWFSLLLSSRLWTRSRSRAAPTERCPPRRHQRRGICSVRGPQRIRVKISR